jgi:outer membrane lipoprotein-sorting protein
VGRLGESKGELRKESWHEVRKNGRAGFLGAMVLWSAIGIGWAAASEANQAAVIPQIDAAVQMRVNRIAGYTVTEHYAVFRGKDETHSVAEMTVKTTYRKETGKSYQVLSTGGSSLVRKLGLDPLLENERQINLPGNVEHSWITSANYEMTLKPGTVMVDGRECLVVAIHPKRKAPNLIEGKVWVDAKDYTIVRLEGVSSKAPSVFAGVTHMMRQYANVDGFSMATHARAESNTFLYGRTVVTIDYSGYQIELRPGR